ncbi:hypothetical protein [Nonomuraea sp. SBT364]|nr:hypothetical protein [Nonomuraea sp. SBT364]
MLEGARWTFEHHRPTRGHRMHVWHGHRRWRTDRVAARRRNYLFAAG